MTETLQEFCDSRGVAMGVDRQAGVIRGVKILGLRSRNGRTYLPEALSRAAGLYEQAKVNVNHPKGNPGTPRDYQDRIGTIRNVAARPGEGLFADLHFNPKHALAEQLIWDAEHAPENVGFSHNVQARTRRDGQRLIVEAITSVQSVDLVADPATTRGLFESGGDREEPNSSDAGQEAGSAATPEEDAAVVAPEGDSPIMAARGSGQSPARESGQSPTRHEMSVDELRREHPELVEAVCREQAAELDGLRAEVERLRALEAAHELRQLARRVLREFNLPDPEAADPKARLIVSEQFMESLLASDGEQAMRELVRERAELARGLGSTELVQRGSSGRPLSRDQYSACPAAKLDTKAFVEAIT
jgi:hypothetical protein